MKQNKWIALLPALGLVLLILDAKCAMEGAKEGITLCLATVVPALFPYFVLTAMLVSTIPQSKFLSPLGKICRMPPGTEHLFLLALSGGYPTGARAIRQAYENKPLSLGQARRFMGFCNHPGPAFIFGICGGLFSGIEKAFLLWTAIVFSAVCVGAFLPRDTEKAAVSHSPTPIQLPKAVQQALRSTVSVCGWVILFRILLRILHRWLIWLPGGYWRTVMAGLLEITNGCTMLPEIHPEGLRFLLCGIFLCLGGICVFMQVLSAAGPVGFGMYIPGKLLQTAICGVILCIMQPLCFPSAQRWEFWLPGAISCLLLAAMLYFLIKSKNNSRKTVAAVV